MGEIKKIHKVKMICGVLFALDWFKEKFNLTNIADIIFNINSKIESEFKQFGIEKIDNQSEVIRFDFSDYYNEEMGKNIFRYWISFSPIIEAHQLYRIKILSNEIEKKYFCDENSNRKVNIDPGYVEGSKLVLFSTKNYSHRIYLDEGIFAEVTLIYKNKQFQILDWTYPDYKIPQALNFFSEVRKSTKIS